VTFFSHTRPWGSISQLPCCAAHPPNPKAVAVRGAAGSSPSLQSRVAAILSRPAPLRRGGWGPSPGVPVDRPIRRAEARRFEPPPLPSPEGAGSGSGSPSRCSRDIRQRTVETALRVSASPAWPPVSGRLVPVRRPGKPARPITVDLVGVVPGVCTVHPLACYGDRGPAPPGSGPGLVVRLASVPHVPEGAWLDGAFGASPGCPSLRPDPSRSRGSVTAGWDRGDILTRCVPGRAASRRPDRSRLLASLPAIRPASTVRPPRRPSGLFDPAGVQLPAPRTRCNL
jgi:hypothetical protein